jgi:hypothetical protein
MSSEYQALIESRAAAKRRLEASPAWKTWNAAFEALSASLFAMEDGPTPPLTTPEALVDGSDHTSDCVLSAYAEMQHEEELRQQLLFSREWRSLQQADSDIKQFARMQLRKRRSLYTLPSTPPSRIPRRIVDGASTRLLVDSSASSTTQSSRSLLSPSSSLLPSLSHAHFSSSPDSSSSSSPSQLEPTVLRPAHSPPPPTEMIIREVNEVAPLPDQEQWNVLCPGLAILHVVGTLADGSCGQSTGCQVLHITPWLRAPSSRANNTRRHPNSSTPTRQQLLALNEKLSDWLSSEEGRVRWTQLCEQTRAALPSLDVQSAEDVLDEMKTLTTPVGLSWWMIFAEVHHMNVFLLHKFPSSLWEPDSNDSTASLLVQMQSQHACRLISRAGQLVPSNERENCMAMLSQHVSSSWADKTKNGTRNVAHYEVVVDNEGRSMWRTTSPIVTEALMPAVSATLRM